MKQPITLAQAWGLTSQKIFDIVAGHLIEQGQRSLSKDEHICAYRGDEGLMCAVGVLIPDELYKSEMEGKAILELTGLNWTFGLDYLAEHRALVQRLQTVHDMPHTWATPGLLQERLREVAQEFDLEPTQCQ